MHIGGLRGLNRAASPWGWRALMLATGSFVERADVCTAPLKPRLVKSCRFHVVSAIHHEPMLCFLLPADNVSTVVSRSVTYIPILYFVGQLTFFNDHAGSISNLHQNSIGLDSKEGVTLSNIFHQKVFVLDAWLRRAGTIRGCTPKLTLKRGMPETLVTRSSRIAASPRTDR